MSTETNTQVETSEAKVLRLANIRKTWEVAPTAPVVLAQDLKEGRGEGAVSFHKEEVSINKLWDAPIEILRGYAHKTLILDAQKACRSRYEQIAAAQKAGKEAPAPTSIQAEYDRLLETFPTVQDVTPAASPRSTPKAPTKEQLMFREIAEAQAAGASQKQIMAIIAKYTATEEAPAEG